MTTVVEIDNLTKDYELGFVRKRRVRALDGLSVSVNAGEIFGFLGANGAGKTTTLKLLMRLIFPTAGTAKILGHDISDISMHSRIGYLPENLTSTIPDGVRVSQFLRSDFWTVKSDATTARKNCCDA